MSRSNITGRCLAAVIGREIHPELLTPADFRWIDYGLESAILEIADGRLQFAHDRIREGILHLTDPDELSQLHAEAARASEQAFAHDQLYDAILARHWAAAHDETQELHYTLAAGQQWHMLPAKLIGGDVPALPAFASIVNHPRQLTERRRRRARRSNASA